MSILHTPSIWYIPSASGDIRCEALDDGNRTKLIWFALTDKELKALQRLRDASVSPLRRWATDETWKKVAAQGFTTGDPTEFSVELDGPIVKVGGVLQRAMRPNRRKVTVIRIGQGEITTMHSNAYEDMIEAAKAAEAKADASADASVEDDAEEETALAVREETSPAPPPKPTTKAATVTQPTIGCPAPTFAQIRRRATRVLQAFLTPEQLEDFETHQRFVTVGADTGHHYMLTLRTAPEQLKQYGTRSVYDLDTRTPFCVHDWDCPPEEELLNLHCLLSLPRFEKWVRQIPDDNELAQAFPDLLPA